MKAKKICALLLASALAVGTVSALAACKKDDGKDNKKFVEDTRLWYAVGRNTKGTLSKFDNFYPQDTSVAFTRDTTVTGENVFTLSLDIYSDPAGYGFKFLYKTSAEEVIEESDLWARQVGIHEFADVQGEGGDAVIKNAAGETVFTTKDGIDANNLYLAKGQEGTYKFTLKTTSDTDGTPTITWEKTAKIDVTHDMYVRGDINDFGVNPIAMNEVIKGDVITWTAQIEVTEADLWRDAEGKLAEDPETYTANGQYAAIQIYNDIDKKTYATIEGIETEPVEVESFNGEKYTCVLVPEGKYSVTYNQADNKITYKQGTHEMYFIGALNGWNTDNAITPEYKLNENDGVWSGMVYLEANAELKLYNGLKSGNDGWCGISGEPEDGIYAAGGDNIKVEEAGIYRISFNSEDGAISVEKLDVKLCVVGTLFDAEGTYVHFALNADGSAPEFGAESSGVVLTATVEIKDASQAGGNGGFSGWGEGSDGAVAAVKPAYVKDGAIVWDMGTTGNNFVPEVGTYTISYNLNTHAITLTKNAE